MCITAYLLLVKGVSWWVVGLVIVGVPAAQWVSLRILEEGWSAYGALRGWVRIRALGEPMGARLRERQEDLRRCVVELASCLKGAQGR